MKKNLENIKIAQVATIPLFFITHLREPLQAISNAGAEITVVTSPDDENTISDSIPSCQYKPILIARNIDIKADIIALCALIRLFRRERFDIVHSNTPKAGLLCAIAAKITGIPIRLHTFTGQPWVTMRGLKKKLIKSCDRLLASLNTHSYVDSPSQCDFLVEQKVLTKVQASILGPGSVGGIDLKRFNLKNFSEEMQQSLKREYQIDDKTFVLLFVGRITPDKGIFELIEALSLLNDEQDFKLLVLGPFEGGIEKEVRSLATRMCPHKIIFAGMQTHPEAFMAISDILCLPSYREGFGTVIMEAAAMGVPSVASKIYGITDAVVDGETGILVEPKKVGPLAEAIRIMMRDKQLRKRLGENAKQRAISLFDSSLFGNLLVEDYKKFLNNYKK